MNFAAFETATEWCSVALWRDGEITSLERRAANRQGEFVLPMFEQVPWLPKLLISPYLRAVPVLERAPVIRRFMGVSTLLVARRRVEKPEGPRAPTSTQQVSRLPEQPGERNRGVEG